MSLDLTIRPSTINDLDSIWEIIKPIIEQGEHIAFPRDYSKRDMMAFWFSENHDVFVAEVDGEIVGSYYVAPNQLGGGAHVANCGYVIAHKRRGAGYGRAICDHSIITAKKNGFSAMQFNFVIETNEKAVSLYLAKGFLIVGRVPKAFLHPSAGLVDVFVMHRWL